MINYEFTEVENSPGTLVFLHGLGQDHSIFDQQTSYLTNRFLHKRYACSTLAVDLRGHGKSPTEGVRISIPGHVNDLEEVLLEEDIDDPIIIGFSLGAAIALEYAHRHPNNTTHLGLINPIFDDPKYLTRKVRLLYKFLPIIGALGVLDYFPRPEKTDLSTPKLLGPLPPILSSHAIPSLLRYITETTDLWGLYTNILALNEHGIPNYLRDMKVPATIIQSSNDELVDKKLAEELFRGDHKITLPNSRKVSIRNANHVAMLSNPHGLNLTLKELLKCFKPSKKPKVRLDDRIKSVK